MNEHIKSEVIGRTGVLTLDRPKALNSLSLAMIRSLTQILMAWRDNALIDAVMIKSSSAKAFCAGGDIRFFYDAGRATPAGGSALLEDFFTEEYALNHLIHHYPKPYVALMDGVVMGGGMGIAQSSRANQLRIVTERTKMAMPEVNIGLFPDVGGSYFLPRAPGKIGMYLGITGETINAADALHAGLADVYLPSSRLPDLLQVVASTHDLRGAIRNFAAPFQSELQALPGTLAAHRTFIDKHFSHDSVAGIMASLKGDTDPFAIKTAGILAKRSPLMMCVTFELLKCGAELEVADCLRLERNLVRRCFEGAEILEGVRALVIDKDNAPNWKPSNIEDVTAEMVARFFEPAWPSYAHPLRFLA
ncbi:MAG TPA: enoyl-CoA hydratase/isomerase family protein [Burkholderiaceae bacterium]